VPPVIERIPTGVLTWEQRKETLAGAADLERIRKEIDAAPAEARTRCLLDLDLSGVLDVAAMARIADLEELASARYLYARVRRDDLRPAMEGTDWIDELPPGVPQAVGKRLMEALRSDDDDTSEAALRALELLHEIAGEADG
jgi:DNA-binding transcriptional MocR family regulator